MKTVLYITYSSDFFEGATWSLTQMIQSVKDWVKPIVLCRRRGVVSEYFEGQGIETIICPYVENIKVNGGFCHYVKSFIKSSAKRMLGRYKSKERMNEEAVSYIAALFHNRKIDIVHTNTGVLDIGVALAKRLEAKHVWHIREFQDLDFGWEPICGWERLRQMMSEADVVIGVSRALLTHFVSAESPNHYSLYNAVRSEKDVYYNPQKRKYFLFCAVGLTKAKGADFAIEAFAKSELYKEGYRLVMVGGYAQTKRWLKGLCHKHGVYQYVDFPGKTNDVRSYMIDASAFLMCSQNEGMGRVTVEAMFYGCPVLGRKAGGTVELIKNGENGYLFSTTDELANLMCEIITTDNSILISNAANFASLNFSTEQYGLKINAIYESLGKKT